jgi:hypothetical protein
MNPLRTVSAWKKNDARSSDLLLVVFLGFLSNVTLVIGGLLNLRANEVLGGRNIRITHDMATCNEDVVNGNPCSYYRLFSI